MDEVIDEVLTKGKDITINDKENNIIYQFISSDNNNNKNKANNISSIDLGECETILKQKYNISNISLLILKSDAFIDNSLIQVVQYEVYHPLNKTKLDLNYCSDTKIDIKIPVSINEDDLSKYEPNSDYYNNMCFSASSKNGADLSLKDRKNKFIEDNLTLCENNCDYLGYDRETKESNCECKVKQEMTIFNIKIDTGELKSKFQADKGTNIRIIKCYYLLFRKNGLKKNIGSYILLSMMFLLIIDLFFFLFIGYKSLLIKIEKVLKYKIGNLKDINNLKTTVNIKNTQRRKKVERKSKSKKKGKNKINSAPKKTENIKKANKIGKNKSNLINFNDNDKSKPTKKSIIKFNNSNINLIINNYKNKEEKKETNKNKKKSIKNILKLDKKKVKNNNNNNMKYNDYEMNRLIYEDGRKYDKRTFIQYYLSLLKTRHILLMSFNTKDYNSLVIKISLFFFSFSLYYTINALFFTDKTMHNILISDKKYDFIYQLPKIFYSNLISTVINCLILYLSLSEKTIIDIKNRINKKNYGKLFTELKKTLFIRFIIFYLFYLIFLLFFWFYVSCFCVVYKNTQIYLIKDTLISFGLSLIYPFGYYLLPGIFRIPALKDKKGSKKSLYTFSQLLQSI